MADQHEAPKDPLYGSHSDVDLETYLAGPGGEAHRRSIIAEMFGCSVPEAIRQLGETNASLAESASTLEEIEPTDGPK